MKLGSEIRRSRTVQTPVNEDSEFVIDPLRHTEPMETYITYMQKDKETDEFNGSLTGAHKFYLVDDNAI